MVCRLNGRRPWLMVFAAVLAVAIALPAAAQSTGGVRGLVKDAKGEAVEGAKVSIDMTAGVKRHFETKTNRRGEFIQIGVPTGSYKVTAEKEGVGAMSYDVGVKTGAPAEVNFVLSPATDPKLTQLRGVFDEGVAASRAGNHDEAIVKFTAAIAVKADCHDCYYNIGFAHTQKKEYDKAEAAYKKAAEIKPDYAEAYNGLANVYNAQRKFDDAAAAGAKAAELATALGAAGGASGGAEALFNQGVILWNAGKVAEAKKQFEGAIAANPGHAESHYQLGMALVNEGNLAGAATEFEKYLELAPAGPNAAQAKALVAQLKK
jgi:Flp pilus assembly protein TadD